MAAPSQRQESFNYGAGRFCEGEDKANCFAFCCVDKGAFIMKKHFFPARVPAPADVKSGPRPWSAGLLYDDPRLRFVPVIAHYSPEPYIYAYGASYTPYWTNEYTQGHGDFLIRVREALQGYQHYIWRRLHHGIRMREHDNMSWPSALLRSLVRTVYMEKLSCRRDDFVIPKAGEFFT